MQACLVSLNVSSALTVCSTTSFRQKKPARPGEFAKLKKKKVVDLDATVVCWEPVQGRLRNLSIYLSLHSISIHTCGA